MLSHQFLSRRVAVIALFLIIAGCQRQAAADLQATAPASQPSRAELWPAIDSKVDTDAGIEARIDRLLARMTVEEKVGQMIQPEIKQVTPRDVKQYHLGSVLNGGGTTPGNDKYASVDDWVALADSYWHASMDTRDGGVAIPIMWGTDAVHGLGNVVGATLFPHNSGLGATRNPDLIEKIGEVTAREIAVTGLDWNFSPTVAVSRDERWGRAYESWSENPELVRLYAGRMVEGLQGDPGSGEFLDERHVIATAKHYIGDGGTRDGIDRGETMATEEQLRDIHGAGYFSAIESGVQAVMVSFSSWHGRRMHGNEYLLSDVLKERMGFDGLVVGDWSGHGFVTGCTPTSCPQAVNAGLDIFMAPGPDWKELFHNTVRQVENGVIPKESVNDAVRRILRVKFRAGLFAEGAPSTRSLAGDESVLGSPGHRAVARQAVRESLVMLKNQNQLLPLSPNMRVLVTGDGADNIGKQTGGWTISWQGTGNTKEDFPGATSIFAGIQNAVSAAGGAVLSEDGSFGSTPDVAIVVYGEDPYAEMHGDRTDIVYRDPDHLALLRRLQKRGVPVVSVFLTGRPLWINPFLSASDAFVVAWLPGTEGQGVADVLFTGAHGEINYDMAGRLPFSWPGSPDQVPLNWGVEDYDPLFPYGYGLSYGATDTLGDTLSQQARQFEEPADKLKIFDLRPLEPWKIELTGDNDDREIMTGSQTSLSTVAARSVDRNVQHDSRRAVWNGKGPGAVALASAERQDLSRYLESGGALVFDVRVNTAPAEKVMLRLGCGSDCSSDVDLTDELRPLAGRGWRTLSVDLGCFPPPTTRFADGSVPPANFFASVYEPFKLVTSGVLDLTFADVSVQMQTADQATIPCQ